MRSLMDFSMKCDAFLSVVWRLRLFDLMSDYVFLRLEDVVKCTPYSCLFVSATDSKPFIAAGLKILKQPLGDGTNSSCQLSGHTQNKIQNMARAVKRAIVWTFLFILAASLLSPLTRLRPFHPVCILLLTSLVHRPLLWMVEPNL